jgi:hypothetical protein
LRRKVAATLAVAAALLLLGTPARAQQDDDRSKDGDDDASRQNLALAVGVGLADINSVAESYLMASLRIRVGGRHAESTPDWRGRQPDNGMRGYFEPEVGYWKATGKNGTGKDTLVGVNLIGVAPLGSVDTFFGAGVGFHSIDAMLLHDPTKTGNQSKIGVNAQFGLDVYLTRSLSLFGTGRFDIVQDAKQNVQSKVYLGIRARF